MNKFSQIAKHLTAEKYTITILLRLYFAEHKSSVCYEYHSHIKSIVSAQIPSNANSHKRQV